MGNHMLDAIRAASRPEALFLTTVGEKRWTYGEMLETSGRMANALVALNVQPGDRVAVQVEKGPEVLMLYLACLRAGAVYLPLNTAYTLAELDYFISDSEPRLVVVSSAAREGVAQLAAQYGAQVETLNADGTGSFAELATGQSSDFADRDRGPDDLAAILYTSGTTGRSKGAMLSHDNLLSNALTLCDYWKFTPADRLIHALPIFHTHGLFVATNVVLLSGASMVLLPKFDADEVLGLMPQASVLMGVPTFYVRLAQHSGLTPEVTSGMRLFISGSAPLLTETHETFKARSGHAILERYGMTETNMNTSNPYNGDRIAGTVGFPLPGVDLRVVDQDTSVPVADEAIGMIEVRGPNEIGRAHV